MFKQRIASLDYSRRGSWLNYTNASFPHLNCIILCFCNLSSDPARKSEMRNKSVLIYFKYQVSIKLVFKYGPCCAWMYHNDFLVGPQTAFSRISFLLLPFYRYCYIPFYVFPWNMHPPPSTLTALDIGIVPIFLTRP